jgi:hypothetical protein
LRASEKAVVAGIGDAIVPFEALLEGLAADVARADEGLAVEAVAFGEAGEEIGLEVEAFGFGFVNPDLRAVLREEHEETEGFGVGDVEVVAREDADPGGAVGEGGVEVGVGGGGGRWF